MISRPLMYGNAVKSPDYSSYMRQQTAPEAGRSQNFAQLFEARQNAGESQVQYVQSDNGMEVRGKLNSGPGNRYAQAVYMLGGQEGDTAEMMASINADNPAKPRIEQALAERAQTPLVRPAAATVAAPQAAPAGRPSLREITMPGQAQHMAQAARENELVRLQGGGRGILLDDRSLGILRGMARKPEKMPLAIPLAPAEQGGDVKNMAEDLGALSAQYESGSAGSAAIGYDWNGGTSYGKYQISSRQGTFDNFIKYLKDEDPALAERLSKAGKANTGSRRGAVPKEWQAIAAEQPERFEQLQEDFIRKSHYEPAASHVKSLLGTDELSLPLRQVIWSTAVQHGAGGAQRLFSDAARTVERQKKGGNEQALIETVYQLRKGQFGTSAPGIQASVKQRLESEKQVAVAMLKEQKLTV